MRTYQKQRVTRIQHACTTYCDVCKTPIDGSDYYREDEVTIAAKIGNIYPEMDSRTVTELDCCADCFRDKVQPLLERELGVKFRKRDAEDFGPRSKDVSTENLGEPVEGV
jgi:hypothetical protein